MHRFLFPYNCTLHRHINKMQFEKKHYDFNAHASIMKISILKSVIVSQWLEARICLGSNSMNAISCFQVHIEKRKISFLQDKHNSLQTTILGT